MSYVPLPIRLQQFFIDNPDEWLTIEDCMAKFGVNRDSAQHLLSSSTRGGKVERISVYRAVVSDQVSEEVSKT